MTGRPAAARTCLVRATWRCCASRSAVELLEMADRNGRGGRDGRRQGGGEDEARRIGADRIDDRGRARDIAAKRAEGLGQRALDDVDPVGEAVAFGDAAAARAIHADRMDLVDIGHGVVFLGQIGDFGDRRDVAIHRIDGFEDDQLGPFPPGRAQQAFEMSDVIVPEHLLFGAGAPHALDHRGMVQLVRQDEAIRQEPARWSRWPLRWKRSPR